MTPAEYEHMRLHLQVEALKVLVEAIYIGMGNKSPAEAQALREQFQLLRQRTEQVVIPGLLPGYSDMVAAEFHTALDGILTAIEGKLRY